MELWQKFWVDGVLPHTNEEQRKRLREALEKDSETLLMGMTVLSREHDDNPTSIAGYCCPIAYTQWTQTETVDEIEGRFVSTCISASNVCGVNWREFVKWWDNAPRQLAIQELLNLM